MNCPKCRMARSLEDRVCRRCKYVFDEDRFISVEPLRASSPAPKPRLPRAPLPGWAIHVASLVPGLGHVLLGRRIRGAAYFGVVAVLMMLSTVWFTSGSGRLLFGLAVSAHAQSMFELTPWAKSESLRTRLIAIGVILAGLMFLYWPLLAALADRFVAPGQRELGRRWGGLQDLMFDQVLLLVLLGGASLLLSRWLGRRLSRRSKAE